MNLRQIRIKNHYTQEQIGKVLSLSKSSINKIEKGHTKLNSEQIIKLCKAMNVTADYLLGLIDENNKEQ